jgi:hypothetical protein
MTKTSLLVACITLTVCRPTFAQGADASGNSAITPLGSFSSSVIEGNSADASVKFNYLRSDSERRELYGFFVQGKSADGLAAIFKNGTLQPAVKLGATMGIRSLLTSTETRAERASHNGATSSFDWLAVQVSYAISSLKLISTEDTGDPLTKRTTKHPSIDVSYNYAPHSFGVLSIGGGYEKTDNYSDLDEADVERTVESTDPVSGNIYTVHTSKASGRTGTLVESNVGIIRSSAYFPLPFSNYRLGAYAYQKSKFTSSVENKGTNIGFSLLILKDGSPTIPLGGLGVELADITNARQRDGRLADRLTINVTATIPIGFPSP